MTEKNALAELAEQLDRLIYKDCDGYEVVSALRTPENGNTLRKAQRIAAALAKVEVRNEGTSGMNALWNCNDCIAKCRAIAEEGAREMTYENEMVDDVIEYIRSLYCHDTVYERKTGWTGVSFDGIADKLEAALKRERVAKQK